MTREEEMWKSVEEEHGELPRREAMIALTAMEWADETMIDKVCKWLKDNIEEFVHGRDWELDKEDLIACLRIEIYEEV